MKTWIRLMVLTTLTALACSGAGVPGTSPEPAPAPKPKPKPKPNPAGNSGDCSKFFGVSLPQEGGVITQCGKAKVTLFQDDAKSAKWTYADAYVAKGWGRGDPEDGSPTVFKDAKQLVFTSSGDNVIITKR